MTFDERTLQKQAEVAAHRGAATEGGPQEKATAEKPDQTPKGGGFWKRRRENLKRKGKGKGKGKKGLREDSPPREARRVEMK